MTDLIEQFFSLAFVNCRSCKTIFIFIFVQLCACNWWTLWAFGCSLGRMKQHSSPSSRHSNIGLVDPTQLWNSLWNILPTWFLSNWDNPKTKRPWPIEKLHQLLSKRSGETQIDCELKVFIFHKITKYCQTTLGLIKNRGVMDGWMKWKPQIVLTSYIGFHLASPMTLLVKLEEKPALY